MLQEQEFVETRLVTKLAEFNVRVYKDEIDKETLVLWTKNLNTEEPVLVRVHSECLTGDVLGSLHCDCGPQLNKSLQLIKEKGGVLIYLRQEGRGIGLFEKMKTYKLQSQGYDTFEANVLLGHDPDARSYDMVKTVLDELKISNIKLITNNPSKVSNIAKFGITVSEIVPLITKTNKHNKFYLETKKNKFNHILDRPNRYYSYQFHVDTYEQVEELIGFVNSKKTDPLLKISVGISTSLSLLENQEEIDRVQRIIEACQKSPDFVSVIHYSFRDSVNPIKDLKKIRSTWAQAERFQVNDLKSMNLSFLKKASKLFALDIPLSDDNFDLIHDQEVRDFVQKSQSFILLDNSKGRGIEAAKEDLMGKINTLLGYGIRDITLCGGFGPDSLSTYFEIKRYYQFNFSIDAETKLKSDGLFDVSKIKRYLSQLIRFDDPNYEGIKQTRKFLEDHRIHDWEQFEIQGHQFLIHPQVFHAGHFPSSAWFAKELSALLKDSSYFCEVGCGSGVISCLTALKNPRLTVVSTDINPHAMENTKINAERLGLSDRISAFHGDVLDSILPKHSFDAIFWALPFGFLDPGATINLEDAQFFDPGYRAIGKLLQTAKGYLKPGGRLFLGFSSELGNYDLLKSLAEEVNASLKLVAETMIQEEVEVKFEILELVYAHNQ